MPHLESKTKLIMTQSVNWYINPIFYNDNTDKLHSNRTAELIVRPKGDKNSLPRSGDSTKPVKTEKESGTTTETTILISHSFERLLP